MTAGNKSQYIADVKVMNYLLQAIPNDIYNSVVACKNAKEMWKRIKRLMFGSKVTSHVRHSRLMDEFDKFAAKEGESLESVYERLTTLVNIIDRNNVRPIPVSINTKFLNCLQHEWSKYVTMHPKQRTVNDECNKIVQRVPLTESTQRKVNVQCYNCNKKGHYACDCRKPIVRDAKYYREQMLLAMKDEAGSNLNDEEKDFMLDNSYGEEIMEDLTVAVILMARFQPADGNAETVPSYDAKAVSEVNASSKVHEQVSHVKCKTIIQTSDDGQIDSNIIFDDPCVENNGGTSEHDSNARDEYHEIQMLAHNELETCKDRVKTFESKTIQCSKYKETFEELERELRADKDTIERVLKEKDKIQAGLGYKNPECLKKAIAAQPKMYDGEMLHSAKLKFYSPDSEETLEDAKESRLKMRNKMVQINYGKLNTLYETFVPQQEFFVEQTYFPIPSTFNNGSESKEVTSDLPIPKMPKEKQKVNGRSSKENILQNEIDRLLEVSLTSEIQNCVLISVGKQKNKLLKGEFRKSSSDSKDIQANLLKRIKILENDFKRSQAQSIDFELKLQHQREKIACDVSWKSKLSTLNDENVLLKTQVDSVVQERENIKLKFQNLFNSIKATRTQNKKEVDELIEHANQKTYAYADVRAQNQDLLMTISELKNKLRTTEKGKNMNTKFDKSKTLGKSVCVTPFNKNIAYKAKNVKNTKVNADRSKPVTSHPTPKNEQSQKQSTNVITRGMYRITKTETQSPDSKSKINVSNSTCVESSNSIRRPKSKETKSNDRVLKNNNDKRPSAHVRKMSSSVSIDSNKRETMHLNVIQLILWIIDSGCSKHMTGNLQLLRNFIEKFMRTVLFRNDHFAAITGYGDYVQGNLTICHVYYVESLEGDDLLTGSRNSNLYTISISEMAASSPVCLMSRATSTKSWLWHRRLSHLNFGTINQLTSKDLVDRLLKFKYNKDHLCSTCKQGKSKKASLPPKLVPSTESKLELLHMDLCGPMRVASINGKKYILVIVDDYSQYTWVYFLRTKDEAPNMIIDFINQVQRNLKAQILTIRTDNGTAFKNEKLWAFYEKLGIVHKTSIARTPQQNGVVEGRNRTLVEAARIMLIFFETPEFLWAEAIATACFTQNLSIVHTQYNKTPYELIRGRQPNVQHFHVFGSLCYPTNDRDDLGKMKPKADIGIFIGYSESSRGFRIYNRQTKKIMETFHVKFDELTTMASECNNLKPRINSTNFQDSSEDSQSVPSKTDLDNLFGPLYEEYYAMSSPEVLDNSAAYTLDNENTFSSSSIVVE
ncbi:retrovirus-related pol polyprotein from transposon TNT 1-94 [Tanacetum coccineum]